MNEICDILEEDIYFVNNSTIKYVDTINGIEDKVITETIKKNFLKESIDYLAEELIFEEKKYYPKKGKLKKAFRTEFAVIKKDRLLKLIKLIEDLEHKLCKCSV